MNFKLILIIFLIQIINIELKEDNKDSDLSKESKTEVQTELLELNDSNFDSTIQNGNNNRWLILFYLETCYHCYRAKIVINRVLEFKEYENINNIKFAAVEVSRNSKCNVRFNVEKIPYIVLVENKTMLELDSYVSEKKILDFIKTNFTNVTNDLKPFPQNNIIKHHIRMLYNSLEYAKDKFNSFLSSKGVNFKFNLITLISAYIFICFVFWIILLYIFMKCFNGKKINKKKIRKMIKKII